MVRVRARVRVKGGTVLGLELGSARRRPPLYTSFGSKNCDISSTLPPPASISFIDESMSTQLSGPLGDCTYWSTWFGFSSGSGSGSGQG